jgi:hypothetical protein
MEISWLTFTIGCNLWPSIEGQFALGLNVGTLFCGGISLKWLVQGLVKLAFGATIDLAIGLAVDLWSNLVIDFAISLVIC